MKLRLQSKYLLAAALGLALTAGAHAQLNLFNTGVDVGANGFDDNYRYLGTTTVGVSLAGPGVNAVIANQPGFPFATGNWPVNNATSSWIMPTPTGTLADGLAVFNAPGVYQFRTSFFFDATVYDLNASSVVFNLMADNKLDIYLNGGLLAAASTPIDNNVFAFDTQFVLSAGNGLAGGNNVLDFYLTNVVGDPILNPAGFRIEQNAALTVIPPIIPVPEPSTYGLIGAAALLGLVVVRRIRSKSAIA